MGFTLTYRPKGQSNFDFFAGELAEGYELLDAAQAGFGTVHLAVKRPDGKVYGSTVVVKYTPRAKDGWNFGFVWTDESAGPYPANAPARILDLLSPLEELGYEGNSLKWAGRWRKTSRAILARPKLALRTGAILALDKPIQWNGASLDRLEVKNARRLIFRHLGGYGGLYKIGRAALTVAGAHVEESTKPPNSGLTIDMHE